MTYRKHLPTILTILVFIVGLGCSAGQLLVRAPLPTPTPTKTPKPTFTATLIPADTPIPSATPTWTPEPTATETPIPTDTPEAAPVEEAAAEPTATPVPPTNTPAPVVPQAPTNTPVPPTDTPIPTPSYPYPAVVTTHLTGGDIEFRISGFVWEGDLNRGFGEAQIGFQMKVITPAGAEEVSEISVGPSAGASTVQGAGDNHSMNFQYKHAPYLPGTYKVMLMSNGVQMAPTVDVVAQAGPPYTYAHIDFLKQR
jgi:hypothetical protein